MALTDQFNAWADKLVDLSGKNDWISFRQTKNSTLALSEQAAKALMSGEPCRLRDLFDLKDSTTSRQLKTLMADAKENSDESGIDTLRFIDGFAEWNSEKNSKPYAPFRLFEVRATGGETSLDRAELQLDPESVMINPVWILLLRSQAGLELSDEMIEALNDGSEAVKELFLKAVPAEWELRFHEGLFLKNLNYQKLPMVEDLRRSTDALSKHKVIAALAGDAKAIRELQQTTVTCSKTALKTTPTREEFLILDADASQQWAINTALAGQNLVIEGPPGTGKSQTIANLIGALLARGQTVLFVSEKRAAIEAVKKRIVAVGLDALFHDLHDVGSGRGRPAEPFVKALDGLCDAHSVDHLALLHQEVDESRQRLLNHSQAVHTPRQPWGLSYHNVASMVVDSSRADTIPLTFTPAELKAVDHPALERIEKALRELAALPTSRALNPGWVLSEALLEGRLKAASLVSELLDQRDGLAGAWPHVERWLERLQSKRKGREALSLEKTRELATGLEVLYGVLAKSLDVTLLQSFSAEERAELRHQLAKGTQQSLLARIIDRPHRRAIKQALRVAQNEETGQIPRALELIAQLEVDVHLDPALRDTTFAAANEALATIQAHRDELAGLGLKPPGRDAPIQVLREWLEAATSDRQLLIQAPAISEHLGAIEAAGATRSGLIAKISAALVDGHPADSVVRSLRSAWAKQVEEKLRLADPWLAQANRGALDAAVERFRRVDRKSIVSTPLRIRRLVAERADQWRLEPEGERQVQLLRNEAIKRQRKGRLSARRLFKAAPELLTALKPCWAMSPLVVSQILPSDRQYFDVVIFDEASQIVPYEAVTAILRGKQVVVAGDSKQLAPTSTTFFASHEDDETAGPEPDDDETESATDLIQEAESLLGAMKSCLPPLSGIRQLRWHYRSEDERLIAFSNAHPDLYNRSLITLPGAGGLEPFRYHLVEGDRAALTGVSPAAEVKHTVNLILDHLQERPEQSLAVVAFGSIHANNIRKAFERALGSLPSQLQLHPDGRPDEIFRIRHLETIQGDERDVVIIATGYGLNKSGEPRYGFGPINIDANLQGLRRLNVAITRARRRVEIVTTIQPDRYDDKRLTKIGSKALINFMRFARSGGNDLGDLQPARAPMNPFEQDIHDALTAEGLRLIPQHGVSGYRLDFAVRHPEQHGRYVLAIEADGAAYHSSDSARDRDRLRQEHLERMGWRFHRIWSTEWIHNREGEIRAAVQAYEQALNRIEEPISTTAQGTLSNDVSTSNPQELSISNAPRRASRPTIPQRPRIDDYSDNELLSLLQWVQSDQVLRSNDEIIRQLLPQLGFQRLGPRIEERLMKAIKTWRG
jgi:very-short-patch-repair endonuclease